METMKKVGVVLVLVLLSASMFRAGAYYQRVDTCSQENGLYFDNECYTGFLP